MPLVILELALRIWLELLQGMTPEQKAKSWQQFFDNADKMQAWWTELLALAKEKP